MAAAVPQNATVAATSKPRPVPTDPEADVPNSVDASAWAAKRRVPEWARRKLVELEGCQEVVVGPQQEPALSCLDTAVEPRGMVDYPAERVVHYAKIVVVRGRRVVPVLDAALAVAPMVKEDMDHPDIINTRMVLSDDGLTATISDDKPAGRTNWVGCDVARVRVAQRLAEQAQSPRVNPYDELDADFVGQVCDGLGPHKWAAGRFVSPRLRGSTSGP